MRDTIKIIDRLWFTPPAIGIPAVIGLIVIENENGDRKAYLGYGESFDEESDTRSIVDHGAPVYPGMVESVRHHLGLEGKKVQAVAEECSIIGRHNYELEKENESLRQAMKEAITVLEYVRDKDTTSDSTREVVSVILKKFEAAHVK